MNAYPTHPQWRWPLLAFIPLALIACEPPGGGDELVTWQDDIAPLIQTHCADCHSDVGKAPGRFDHFEDAAPRARLIAAYVERGLMPPPTAHGDSLNYEGAPSPFGSYERALVKRWAMTGAPRGTPREGSGSPPEPRAEGDRMAVDRWVTMPHWEPPLGADGWSVGCVAFEPGEATFLTGAAPHLDGDAIVSEMRLYFALPRADSPVGAGVPFVCDDATREASPELDAMMATWRPLMLWGRGAGPVELPGGVAIPRGAALVLKVSYEATPGMPGPASDQSGLGLRLDDSVERVLKLRIAQAGSFTIPAGEADYVAYTGFQRNAPTASPDAWRVWALTPIMGHLGAAATVYTTDADHQRRLLDGPYSSFRQPAYRLTEPAIISEGEYIGITCHFDNSANYHDPILPLFTEVSQGDGPHRERCELAMWVERAQWDPLGDRPAVMPRARHGGATP